MNANALSEGISEALNENSAYYLLGWRPDTEKQWAGRSNIQVTVKGRPDLKVRTRRHYFDLKTDQTVKTANSSTSSPEDDLKTALASLYPRRDVPTFVAANIDLGTKGQLLNLSMKIDSGMLAFDRTSGKEIALVDVLGAAIDDRGVCSTFRQKLEIPREALSQQRSFREVDSTAAIASGPLSGARGSARSTEWTDGQRDDVDRDSLISEHGRPAREITRRMRVPR